MTLRRSLTLAIVIAVLAGILLGGLALTNVGSVVSKAVPNQLRGDDGESEPDENEVPERTSGTSPSDDSSRANDEPDGNEAPERSGTSQSDDSSRANDEADEREPSEGGADEAERGNEP